MSAIDDKDGLVASIHGAPQMLVLAVTGGGMATITDLLLVPGASRTVLEVLVPYAASSLEELIEGRTDGAVTEATADAMALACAARAHALAPDGVPIIGVACTAALATDRVRRGADRAHLAIADATGVVRRGVRTWPSGPSGDRATGHDSRVRQDRETSDALLLLVADACGVGGQAEAR